MAKNEEEPSSRKTKRRSPARGPTVGAVVGWREWVSLPELGIDRTKAKIDTGARTSSMHAFDLERFRRDGRPMVRFEAHPIQRDTSVRIPVEAELVDRRSVRSSSGDETVRPVIETDVVLLGQRWPIELTLIRRDMMGFRMLLGRQALRGRFVVDPGRSFLGGKPDDRSDENP
ncbi:MAG: ATP-dependent zinc protease [Gemmatimonadota bacterium]